jgi:MarR family transcriptional regulator, organic hydroperoxide resistance regulator
MKSAAPLSNQEFIDQWHEVLAPYGVGYRIKFLAQLSSRRFQEKLEPFGLTPFHWVVLCCLWEEDGLPTSTICGKLQQVGGTLTGVLDRMEERNLIRRERDVRDRRIWRIWLTEEGNRLREVLPPLAKTLIDQAMDGIPETDRQHLSRMLDQIIANMS